MLYGADKAYDLNLNSWARFPEICLAPTLQYSQFTFDVYAIRSNFYSLKRSQFLTHQYDGSKGHENSIPHSGCIVTPLGCIVDIDISIENGSGGGT